MIRRTSLIAAAATLTSSLVPAAIATGAPQIVETGGSLASMTGSASPYGVSQARGASLAARDSRAGAVRVRLHLDPRVAAPLRQASL